MVLKVTVVPNLDGSGLPPDPPYRKRKYWDAGMKHVTEQYDFTLPDNGIVHDLLQKLRDWVESVGQRPEDCR